MTQTKQMPWHLPLCARDPLCFGHISASCCCEGQALFCEQSCKMVRVTNGCSRRQSKSGKPCLNTQLRSETDDKAVALRQSELGDMSGDINSAVAAVLNHKGPLVWYMDLVILRDVCDRSRFRQPLQRRDDTLALST